MPVLPDDRVIDESWDIMQWALQVHDPDNWLGRDGEFLAAAAAVIPFIQQFAMVDQIWFDQSPYPRLRKWSAALISSDLFNSVMQKHAVWQNGKPHATS